MLNIEIGACINISWYRITSCLSQLYATLSYFTNYQPEPFDRCLVLLLWLITVNWLLTSYRWLQQNAGRFSRGQSSTERNLRLVIACSNIVARAKPGVVVFCPWNPRERTVDEPNGPPPAWELSPAFQLDPQSNTRFVATTISRNLMR